MTNGEHAPRVSDGHWCTRRRANVCKCAFAPRRTKSAACPGGRIRPRSRLVLAAPPRATTGRVRPGLWTRDVYCAVRRARSALCTLGLGAAFQAPRQACFDGDCARHGGSPTCHGVPACQWKGKEGRKEGQPGGWSWSWNWNWNARKNVRTPEAYVGLFIRHPRWTWTWASGQATVPENENEKVIKAAG